MLKMVVCGLAGVHVTAIQCWLEQNSKENQTDFRDNYTYTLRNMKTATNINKKNEESLMLLKQQH
jgi:hypothetical protein